MRHGRSTGPGAAHTPWEGCYSSGHSESPAQHWLPPAGTHVPTGRCCGAPGLSVGTGCGEAGIAFALPIGAMRRG